MIGPAELHDLMLDHAETFAVNALPNRAERLRWPMSAWQNAFQRIAAPQAGTAAFALQERAGRFVVVAVATGQEVYSPPDFIQPSRAEFDGLLASLDAGAIVIDAVATFEGEATPVEGKMRYLALAA